MIIRIMMVLAVMGCFETSAPGQVQSKAIREAAEYVIKKFSRETGKKSADDVANEIASLTAKHGEDAIEAVRKVGPAAFRIAEEAGANEATVIKLLAKFGDDGVWLARQPAAMRLVTSGGTDAAAAIIKHPGVAEPLITEFGSLSSKALVNVNRTNALRLGILQAEGFSAKSPQADRILEIVASYGDRAMDFIWRNKGALVLIAGGAIGGVVVIDGAHEFWRNPQPFIDGTKDLGVAAISTIGGGVVSRVNWTLVMITGLALAAGFVVLRRRKKMRSQAA